MPLRYNLRKDFTGSAPDYTALDPYWVIAIIELAYPLSYLRNIDRSVSNKPSDGVQLRYAKPFVITDAVNLTVSGNKSSYTKTLNATLKTGGPNYLLEILPGDWAMAWIVYGKEKYEDLLRRIHQGEPCNKADDGLKFIGRVHSIRKTSRLNPISGVKTTSFNLQCSGFTEFETQFFYDINLDDTSRKDTAYSLQRLGTDWNKFFIKQTGGNPLSSIQNNINQIMPVILDVLLGSGVAKFVNVVNEPTSSKEVVDRIKPAAGAGAGQPDGVAFSVPTLIGNLMNKTSSVGDTAGSVLRYTDLLELQKGIQKYQSNTITDGYGIFIPNELKDLYGTFMPLMPAFVNKPVWSVMQQYLNSNINEMYTCLKVNSKNEIVPTLVIRQIPFTTDAFNSTVKNIQNKKKPQFFESLLSDEERNSESINFTRFLELPRWYLPKLLVQDVDIGRSDATKFNFVHLYGSETYTHNNTPFAVQIVNNPPIRDDLDISRSGVRTYQGQVDCHLQDTLGKVPTLWMRLVADRLFGSQYTLNGSISCYGLSSPVAEGDNIEFDGIVYHIESISHSAQISSEGLKSFHSSLTVSNGMMDSEEDSLFPSYPGFTVAKLSATPDFGMEKAVVASRGILPYVDVGLDEEEEAEFAARQDEKYRNEIALAIEKDLAKDVQTTQGNSTIDPAYSKVK